MDTQYLLLITEVLRAYQEAKKVASIDLNEVDILLRSGYTARKTQAYQDTVSLERSLRELVDQDSAAIIPYGPKEHQEEYAALAEDEGCAITVSANALYIEIARLIEPFLGPGRAFTPDTGRALLQAMTRLGNDMGLMSFVFPFVHNLYNSVISTTEALQIEVKTLVRQGNGDEFATAYLSYLVAKKVLEEGYEQNIVPVVVVGATEEEAKGDFGARVFGGRTVVLSVKDRPEKNDVVVAFKHLKPLLKRATAAQQAFNLTKARAAKDTKKDSPTEAGVNTDDI